MRPQIYERFDIIEPNNSVKTSPTFHDSHYTRHPKRELQGDSLWLWNGKFTVKLERKNLKNLHRRYAYLVVESIWAS